MSLDWVYYIGLSFGSERTLGLYGCLIDTQSRYSTDGGIETHDGWL